MFNGEIKILQMLESIRNDTLNNFFELVTMLGEETIMVILIAVLWFAFDKRLAQKIFFITAVSLGINSIIKNIIKIPRPFAEGEITCVRADTATGYSFPSGHTQNFSTWISVVSLQIRKRWFSDLAGVLIISVAFSRMFLGAHYPSDVIAGGIFGVVFAFMGNMLYDRIEDKNKLYIGVILLLAPFAVIFMIKPDLMYADFYKTYGMILGLFFVTEKKSISIDYSVGAIKKILRIVISILTAYLVKEGIGTLNVTNMIQVSFLMDTIGYMALVVIVLGICPILFNKLKI